jgi:CheY-like chemotaxis protein
VVASLIALVEDLMFLSRVREAARGTGLEVRVARKTADVLEAARAGAALLVVDLDSRRLPWGEAVTSLRSDPALGSLPVVGFLSHVNAEAAQAARAAGCTQVLARSAFVQELPGILVAAVSPGSAEAK